MELAVYSLKGILFKGDAESLNLKTQSGEITVLRNHIPIVTLLEEGDLKIGLPNGEMKEIRINSGFLEVDGKNNLTLLAD